jgi:tRNA(His) 5'-end guanylyltransferase
MKAQYENRTRFSLPRRTYTIIRCDGKSFHSYTRRFVKPFDPILHDAMTGATALLCQEAQGAAFGYTQSDEISVLITDFSDIKTEAWFDGNLQKIVSVSASIITAAFRECLSDSIGDVGRPLFDARVFTIPDPTEVENYFIWRQQDATRNSIQGLAQAHFSHKQLHGVDNNVAQDMLVTQKGINWNDMETRHKRGACIVASEEGWCVDLEIPVFTQDRTYLHSRIPRLGEAG